MVVEKLGKWGKRCFLLLLALFGTLLHPWDLDSDAWFLLASGRYVSDYGIPYTEPLSMHDGLHFVMEQWFFALVFWKIYLCFGASGLVHLSFIGGILVLFCYYRLALFLSGGNNLLSATMTMMLSVPVSVYYFVTRPQVFSALIFLIEIFLTEKFINSKDKKWLYPLPLLSLILVNIHAALWPMIFVLLLPYMVAWFFGKIGKIPEFFSQRDFSAAPLFLAAVFMFGAGFLNPYGIEAMTFLFNAFDPKIHGNIGEVKPVIILSALGLIYYLWSFVLVLTYSRNKMPLEFALLSFGTMVMGASAGRNVFLFCVLGTIPLAYAYKNWQPKLRQGDSLNKTRLAILAVVGIVTFIYGSANMDVFPSLPLGSRFYLCVMFLSLLCYFFCYRENGTLFSAQVPILRLKFAALLSFIMLFSFFLVYYPTMKEKNDGATYTKAMDFLLDGRNAQDISLWTGFNTGAYAEFRGLRPYVDARPEVFLPKNSRIERNIIGDYFRLARGEIYYKDFFRENKFTHILTVPADGAVFYMLPHDKDFRQIYEEKDDKGEILCRIFEPIT